MVETLIPLLRQIEVFNGDMVLFQVEISHERIIAPVGAVRLECPSATIELDRLFPDRFPCNLEKYL